MADEEDVDVGYPARSGVEVADEPTDVTSDNGHMSDDGLGTPPVREVDSPGPFSSPSVVDMFQQELNEISSAESVFIPVKGYEQTGLQIRYHMPESGKVLGDINTRVSKQYKDTYSRNLYVAISTMIQLCDGLYVQPSIEGEPEVDEPVMLDPDEMGMPVQFDERLAEMMGMEVTQNLTARQVVRRLFGNNEMAILAHAERLSRWLQNTKADINAEMWQVGE